jgi:tetratricopeptide (TPR) repeat protein
MSEHDEAFRAAGEALELASGLGLPTPVRALAARAAARCAVGDDLGFDDYRSALAEARAQGLGRETGIVYFNWAEDTGNAWGPRAALTLRAEGLAFARRRSDRAMAHSLAMGLVWDMWWSGDWKRAVCEIDQLAPQLEDGGGLAELAYVRAMHARLLVAQGRGTDAKRFLPLLEEAGRGRGEPELRGECLLAAAGIRLALGELDEACRHLVSCAEIRELACEPMFDWFLPQAVRLAGALGDRELTLCFGTRPRPERPLYRCVHPSASAALAEADRDSAVAAADFRVATKRWDEMGVPHEAALARLGEGRCLLALGRAPDAAAPLTKALEILTGLGARPDAEAARALLAVARPA